MNIFSFIVSGLVLLAFLFWFISSYLIWKTQDINIFPGTGRPFGPHPELQAYGAEAVTSERDSQILRYYDFPVDQPKAALLLFHGNWDGAFERIDFPQHLGPAGIRVILAEFPGYAGQTPPTHEWAVLRNALAVYDEILGRVQACPLFLAGESLGTGPATYVASLRRVPGLILSTPYTSMADVAKARFPWVPIHQLIRHPILARLWAPVVSAPVLIIHGTQDKTVPYRLGEAQAKNFRHLRHFETIEGAGHPDLRSSQNGRFWRACLDFIDSVLSEKAK